MLQSSHVRPTTCRTLAVDRNASSQIRVKRKQSQNLLAWWRRKALYSSQLKTIKFIVCCWNEICKKIHISLCSQIHFLLEIFAHECDGEVERSVETWAWIYLAVSPGMVTKVGHDKPYLFD